MSLWHISLASEDRLPLFPGESLRRKALHVLARIAARVLLLFSIVDEHLHLVSIDDRQHTRRLRQSLTQALTPISASPLARSWSGPVKNRKHLLRLLRYHLVQVVKHHVQGVHPALFSGSCFQDLVGARAIPGLELQTAEQLPREQLVSLACQEVGLPGLVLRPVPVEKLRELGMVRIKSAAASVVAADPSLAGRAKIELLARRLAARLGQIAGIARHEIGWALGLTRQGLCKLLKSEVPEGLLDAAGRRLAIERAVECRGLLGSR